MTLNHYLMGVSAHSVTQAEPEESKTKKRDLKKQAKDKAKMDTVDFESETTPLKVNFARFLADERKAMIVAFAQKKLASDDPLVTKVYKALLSFDFGEQGFFH